MKQKTKRITLSIGHGFLTAFVNADDSGMSDLDKKRVNEIIAKHGPYFHVMMSENDKPNFQRCDVSGLMDDCYDCEVEVSDTTEDAGPYVSSVVNKYGDREKVPTDCKALYDIIARQGASLLIDCIAESVGTTANNFSLNAKDRSTLVENLIKELQSALNERT